MAQVGRLRRRAFLGVGKGSYAQEEGEDGLQVFLSLDRPDTFDVAHQILRQNNLPV